MKKPEINTPIDVGTHHQVLPESSRQISNHQKLGAFTRKALMLVGVAAFVAACSSSDVDSITESVNPIDSTILFPSSLPEIEHIEVPEQTTALEPLAPLVQLETTENIVRNQSLFSLREAEPIIEEVYTQGFDYFGLDEEDSKSHMLRESTMNIVLEQDNEGLVVEDVSPHGVNQELKRFIAQNLSQEDIELMQLLLQHGLIDRVSIGTTGGSTTSAFFNHRDENDLFAGILFPLDGSMNKEDFRLSFRHELVHAVFGRTDISELTLSQSESTSSEELAELCRQIQRSANLEFVNSPSFDVVRAALNSLSGLMYAEENVQAVLDAYENGSYVDFAEQATKDYFENIVIEDEATELHLNRLTENPFCRIMRPDTLLSRIDYPDYEDLNTKRDSLTDEERARVFEAQFAILISTDDFYRIQSVFANLFESMHFEYGVGHPHDNFEEFVASAHTLIQEQPESFAKVLNSLESESRRQVLSLINLSMEHIQADLPQEIVSIYDSYYGDFSLYLQSGEVSELTFFADRETEQMLTDVKRLIRRSDRLAPEEDMYYWQDAVPYFGLEDAIITADMYESDTVDIVEFSIINADPINQETTSNYLVALLSYSDGRNIVSIQEFGGLNGGLVNERQYPVESFEDFDAISSLADSLEISLLESPMG